MPNLTLKLSIIYYLTTATLHSILYMKGIIMKEQNKIKFVELANSRVNKAIKLLRLISNLANKSHYTYSQSDADKIINTLNQEIKSIRDKFNSKNSRDTKEFKI